MARLIYSAIASLDGYVADADGTFDWAAPDTEVHEAVNELERHAGTYLYGRRMYDVMRFWETAHEDRGPAAGRPGLREHLAGGRQGRLLADAARRGDRAHPDRARVRSGRGARAEGLGHP